MRETVLCSLPQQVDAIQKLYKTDVVRALYSQVSLEVIHISQECLCSFCKNTGSCAHLTQIYTNALVYICELEWPTNRAVGFTIPADSTPFTIPSNRAYDELCWTKHGRRISSQPRSHSPNCISFVVIFTSFSDLHHYRLTSLQTYVIVKSQRILTTTFMYIFLVILFSFVILTISNYF